MSSEVFHANKSFWWPLKGQYYYVFMYLILDSNGIPQIFGVYLQSKKHEFQSEISQFEYQETGFIKIIVNVLAFVPNIV